ncbi:sigma-70 family RNA polymerase sigma factor [Streptomyces sp. NPDC001177]
MYEEHASLLLRFAARLLGGDWHRAEDLVQEAVLRAWRHSAELAADPERARPWLFTVVRNLAIDDHRARRLRPAQLTPFDNCDIPVEDEIERTLTSQVVQKALQDLSDQHREIIKYMYYLGCSVAQASELLGIPPGTVKSRSYYAVRALKEALLERGVGSD